MLDEIKKVAGDQEIVIKVPNASRVRSVAEGDAVRIGWRTEDCHALDVLA